MNAQKKILIFIVCLSSITLYAFSDTVTRTAVADTYVSIDAPTSPHGTESNIGIGTYQSMLGYIRFDFSSIPSSISIQSARLRLYCSSSAFSTGSILLTRAATSWSESTLTWNNRINGISPSVTFNAPGSTGWWSIDVTAIVKEWLEKGGSNYGFRLEKGESGLIMVSSKEISSYAPKLDITYQVNRFSASGKVTGSLNEGVQQVELSFSRESGTGSIPNPVYTSALGEWSQSDFEVGTTYRVTPKQTVFNYVFNPSFTPFSGSSGNVTGLNFTTTTTYSITFTSVPTGANVTTSGYTAKTTPCTFTGLLNSRVFTIAKSGYYSQEYVSSQADDGKNINISLIEIKPIGEIIDFVVPIGLKVRETNQSVQVKIRNNGEVSKSFWVGLSIAHEDATNSGWPILWYDIKPQASSVLTPGQQEVITFNFIIPPNLKPGNYYACAAVWNSFNTDDWLMVDPRYDDTRNYSKWKDKETGKMTFYLDDFEIDQPNVVEQLKKIVQLSVFENKSLEEMYFDGTYAKKALLYIKASVSGPIYGVPVSAGSSILVDLADLFQITPEGKEGFVTMWVDGTAGIVATNPGFDVTIGIMTHEFNYNERAIADERKDVILKVGGKIGFWPITLVSYDFNSQMYKGPRLHSEGTAGISVGVTGTIQGLVSKEVSRDDMFNAIVDAFKNENLLESSISLLTNNLFTICNIMTHGLRNTTWDDGSWPLSDGVWESSLKLSKQYDGNNDKKLYAHHFYINVPLGTRSLNVTTSNNSGGFGNVDLFLKHNGRPDLDGQPYQVSSNSGNSENINIANPSTGRWYIMLPSISPYDNVRVNASLDCIPAKPSTITGSTSVCQGSSQTYSISPVIGATSYTWTLPGWSGSSTSATITTTVGSSGGTISVTANNTCGFSTPCSLSVSVNSLTAQPGSITGTTTVCQGSSQTYSISTVSGATSYTWTLPSGWSGNSTSTSIIATAGASGGTISVTANNSCGASASRTLSVSVTATPAQPGVISGLTSVCQGTSNTYSISSVSGATSYTWTLPSGWSGNSSSTSIAAIAGASGGTISVTANNSCGSSISRTLSVSTTVIPAQPGSITGTTTVCQGSSNTYSISSVSGATSYTWTLPSGWSGNSSSTSIAAIAGASGGTISVTANNSCGSSISRTLSVSTTVIPAQPGSISGLTSVCQGSSNTYSISSVSGATSYTWTLPSGWSGNSSSTSVAAIAGASGGTISVTANNSCGSSISRTLSVSTTVIPAQPGSISGLTSVCQGSSNTYSISSVSGATSYTWTLPSGWSGNSSSTSIAATAGASGGFISVAANNSCGSGASRTLSVSVTATPAQPGAISGLTSVCQGTTNTYSISPVSGATSYTWSLPFGWSGNLSSTSVAATAGASGGTISVKADNSCGSSTARTTSVTVPASSIAPTQASANLASICKGDPSTLTVTGGLLGAGASWQWYSGSCGSTSVGIGGQISVSPTSTTTFFVRAEGSCNTTNCVSVTVTVNNCSGIETNEVFKGIAIYPNPAHHNLSIENNNSYGPIGFEIINSNGKKIYNSILNKKVIIDLSDYSAGIYFIRFTDGSSNYLCKFIKE